MLNCYGVDLGGRFTLIAKSNFFTADVVLTDEQQRQTENVIGFKGQQRFIGETAALQYRSNILNTTKGFHQPRTFHYRGQEILLQPEQQIGAFLRKLVQSITEPIIISYPDFYTQFELVQLWRAIKISQVNVIATIPENMALMAYINYGQKLVQADNLLIIDFGHTKFTAFLLEKEKVICEVFNRQGTQTMDQLLAQWIIREAKIQPDQKSYLKILDSCENVRKRLNANKQFLIDIENIVPGVDFNFNLSRQQYEKIVEPVLSEISSLCFDLFSQCQQHPFDVIVSIGGGSRIPCFQECVATIFQGKQIQSTIHATEAICQGCAVAGNLILQRKQANLAEHYLNLYEHYPIFIGVLRSQFNLPDKNIREFLIKSGEQCFKFHHLLTLNLAPNSNIIIFYDPPPINFPSAIKSYPNLMATNVSFYYDDYGIIQMQSQGQIIIPVQDQNLGLQEMVQMELEMEKHDKEIQQIHELKYQLETKLYEIRNDLKNKNYSIPQFEKVGYILEDAERLVNSENSTAVQLTQTISSIENEIKEILS